MRATLLRYVSRCVYFTLQLNLTYTGAEMSDMTTFYWTVCLRSVRTPFRGKYTGSGANGSTDGVYAP